jgi:hypothetical protein
MRFTASFVADGCTVESLVSHVHALLCDTVMLRDCAEVHRQVTACGAPARGAQWRRRKSAMRWCAINDKSFDERRSGGGRMSCTRGHMRGMWPVSRWSGSDIKDNHEMAPTFVLAGARAANGMRTLVPFAIPLAFLCRLKTCCYDIDAVRADNKCCCTWLFI